MTEWGASFFNSVFPINENENDPEHKTSKLIKFVIQFVTQRAKMFKIELSIQIRLHSYFWSFFL